MQKLSSCLKRWDLDYDSMLQVFSLPHLSVHHEYMHHISYTHVAFVINDMDFFFNFKNKYKNWLTADSLYTMVLMGSTIQLDYCSIRYISYVN